MAQKKIAIIHRKDEIFAGTLRDIAERLGYTVAIMGVDRNTETMQVSSFVDEDVPDLVLLAVNYQRNEAGEGIGSLIEIRKNHPKEKLPVIMVSGGNTHHDLAMKEGATGYLPIGVGIKEYGKLLESTLNNNLF